MIAKEKNGKNVFLEFISRISFSSVKFSFDILKMGFRILSRETCSRMLMFKVVEL